VTRPARAAPNCCRRRPGRSAGGAGSRGPRDRAGRQRRRAERPGYRRPSDLHLLPQVGPRTLVLDRYRSILSDRVNTSKEAVASSSSMTTLAPGLGSYRRVFKWGATTISGLNEGRARARASRPSSRGSPQRALSAMRLRSRSTDSTRTFRRWPAWTTSCGSRTKRSASSETCTSPSW